MKDVAAPHANELAGSAATAVGVVILGIPQAVLIAAMLGAMLSYYFTSSDQLTKIPRLVFGILAMGFAAGWGSLALPQLIPVAGHIIPEALAGLLGLGMPFLLRVGGPVVADYINKRRTDKDKPEGA